METSFVAQTHVFTSIFAPHVNFNLVLYIVYFVYVVIYFVYVVVYLMMYVIYLMFYVAHAKKCVPTKEFP